MKTRNTLTATAVFLIVATLGALVLGAAMIVGAPLSPEEIEGLAHAMNQQELAEVIPAEDNTVIRHVASQENPTPTQRTSCYSSPSSWWAVEAKSVSKNRDHDSCLCDRRSTT